MGRKLSAKGRNTQCRVTTKKPTKIKQPRVKPIKPRKMPDCVYEGYTYHRHSTYRDKDGRTKTYLRCKKFDTEMECPGKGEISHEGIFKCTHEHDDDCKESFTNDCTAFREKLYSTIKTVPGNPKDLYDAVAKEYPIGAQFCPYPQIEGTLIKWRNEDQPTLPTDIAEIAEILLTDKWLERLTYEITSADKDSGTIDKRTHQLTAWSITDKDGCSHVVFGTGTYASNFKNSVNFFVDCTFDVVPNINGAYQFLTVMAEIKGEVLPVAWAIMSRKTEAAYSAVLLGIKNNLLHDVLPLNIITDYEKALQRSLSKIFPGAVLQGCYFHHCHAILKKRQRLGIITRATALSPEVCKESKIFERDLMNLAFLPAELIRDAFESLNNNLKSNTDLKEIMKPLFEYYDSFWLKRVGPDGFSVYDQTRRTNNVLERYHRTLKHKISSNPEICKFLDALKELQEKVHLNLLVVQHDLKLTRGKSLESRMKDKNIRIAWETLKNIDVLSIARRKYIIREFLEKMRDNTGAFLNGISIAIEKNVTIAKPTMGTSGKRGQAVSSERRQDERDIADNAAEPNDESFNDEVNQASSTKRARQLFPKSAVEHTSFYGCALDDDTSESENERSNYEVGAYDIVENESMFPTFAKNHFGTACASSDRIPNANCDCKYQVNPSTSNEPQNRISSSIPVEKNPPAQKNLTQHGDDKILVLIQHPELITKMYKKSLTDSTLSAEAKLQIKNLYEKSTASQDPL